MTAFCNPLVNSYKRLTTGFEAPSQIYWSKSERASLVKIPFQRGQETRIELRSPDGAANPYVVFALCLAAGLEGIEEQMKPQKEGRTEETELLPTNLSEALKAMKEDPLMEEILGRRFLKIYNQAKEKEWMSYMEQISMWELEQYLYKVQSISKIKNQPQTEAAKAARARVMRGVLSPGGTRLAPTEAERRPVAC